MKPLFTIVPICCLGLLAGCGSDSSGEGGTNKLVDIPPEYYVTHEVDPLICNGLAAASVQALPANKVVDNAHAFTELFVGADLNSQAPVPPVDFDKQRVAAIFAGQKPSSGYLLQVEGIRETADNITITYTSYSPTNNCASDTALTYPFCFVAIPAGTKPVAFKEVKAKACINY